MAFRLNTPYYAIPGLQPAGTFGVILEMLLKARLDLQRVADSNLYDEDVNAYLGGLLVSYIDPGYLLGISGVLSRYDLDVHQAIDRVAPDRVRMYRIYKVNADDLLVSLGIFHRVWQDQKPEMLKMKQYYACASECQKRIYGKPTAVAEIQMKLAEGTERYLQILAQARKEYFRFVEQISADRLVDFAHRIETECPVKEKQDELLDAYSAWTSEPGNPSLRQQLMKKVEELQALDPTFRVDRLIQNFPPPLTP